MTNEQILNGMRNSLSQEYQDRIPEATKTNIREIGNAIMSYVPTQNEFLNELLNKIGLTLIIKKEQANRFARYTKTLDYGDTIEEIFVNIFKSQPFLNTNENPFGKNIPDVRVIYHKTDRKIFYKQTVSDEQLRSAFKNSNGLSNLINAIVTSMETSKEYDDYLMYKELLTSYEGYKTVKITGANDSAIAKNLLKATKNASSQLTYMSKDFNEMGVHTITPKAEQVLIIRSDIKNDIDLDVLATIFNVDKAGLETTTIEVDDFLEDDKTLAILVDEDFFRVYQNILQSENVRNPEGLYTNYFLHSWACYSLSKFNNAIRFVKE